MLQRLELVLDDVVDGLPVGPSSMPAGMLAVFHDQVARFLKGNHTDVNLDAVRVAIEAGSYKLIVPMLAMVAGLASDLALLGSGNLDDMDAKRALVVEEWQKAARLNAKRRYRLAVDGMVPVQIHAGSDFVRHDRSVWVNVERYLQGQVIDLGGKKPNLHLQLADGTMIKVATSEDQVLSEDQNLVYRSAVLRVRAEEEIAARKLRNVHLIEFVHPQGSFDAEAFAAMVAKGRKAWADVPNASDWVEEQRGAA
ncbi:MAG: hypothetical protein KDI71_03635 [Xanthomonadales bacterium]|nr:hypothetical protein [Xanthomonadales bacterium]